MDAGRTLRGGIIYCDFFICEFAADQRQRVERSIHVELSPAVQTYLMKDKVQTRLPFHVMRKHGIGYAAGLAVFLQYLVTLKHCQPALYISFFYTDRDG